MPMSCQMKERASSKDVRWFHRKMLVMAELTFMMMKRP